MLEQRYVNPMAFGITFVQDPFDFFALRIDDASQDHRQTPAGVHLLMQLPRDSTLLCGGGLGDGLGPLPTAKIGASLRTSTLRRYAATHPPSNRG